VGLIAVVNPRREVEAESCAFGQLVGHETASVNCGDRPALPVGTSDASSPLVAGRRS
jgi:hypothetical protein